MAASVCYWSRARADMLRVKSLPLLEGVSQYFQVDTRPNIQSDWPLIFSQISTLGTIRL